MSLLNITLVLFLIMDPIGNISAFLKMLRGKKASEQRKIIVREMLFALLAMVIFSWIGEFLLTFLGISELTVRLASGIILFLVAIQIIFPTVDSIRSKLPKGSPFVIPMAIPLTAGPSLLATIMLYAHLIPGQALMLGAIAISWFAALIILLLSPNLHKLIGDNGLTACERLLGMILILLAIQRFMEGIKLFVVHGAA